MDSTSVLLNVENFKNWSASKLAASIGCFLDNPIISFPILGVLIDGHLLLEIFLVLIIGLLMFQKSYKPDNRPLTEKEIDQLCEEWQPEPLHPELPLEAVDFEEPILDRAAEPKTAINGKEVLNLASTNSLGLVGSEIIAKTAKETITKYGVGSCGPRGFYGTIDVHVDLEEAISAFMGVDDTILYSYGLATPPSTIPAFCKRGDIIIADEGVSWAVQNGLSLSRSSVLFFRHNDMADLEAKLKQVVSKGGGRGGQVKNRRFIVTEAVYQSTGQVAPLPDLLRLRDTYRFRLLLEESLSFGVMGAQGRGLTEHHGVQPSEVDIITVGMGHSLGSEGGFCCGQAHMVDHQRLSGLGYCFSASLPPFLASSALSALKTITEGKALRERLQSNLRAFREVALSIPELSLESSPLSPLQILSIKNPNSISEDTMELQRVVDKMREEEGVLLSVTRRSFMDRCRLPVGLRVAISAGHEEGDLVKAAESLKRLAREML